MAPWWRTSLDFREHNAMLKIHYISWASLWGANIDAQIYRVSGQQLMLCTSRTTKSTVKIPQKSTLTQFKWRPDYDVPNRSHHIHVMEESTSSKNRVMHEVERLARERCERETEGHKVTRVTLVVPRSFKSGCRGPHLVFGQLCLHETWTGAP